ncbi:hypothetical protein [Deinococcus sp. SL84]|uniref:hypothetical protein n=1 Tax=Deinococcus sp. SL84 TaxID=2994663 RepID=UPI0022763DB9|nr:hypothetical protein [Deinococcus sp. SL84]MCY1703724.1 hypothetical protein [Deinococcus sp. SL84]
MIDKKAMQDANFTFEIGFFIGKNREKIAFFGEVPPLNGFMGLPTLVNDIFSGVTGLDSLTQQILDTTTPLKGNIQREKLEDIYGVDDIDFGFDASSPITPETLKDPVLSLFDTANLQIRAFIKPAQKVLDEQKKSLSLKYDSKNPFFAKQLVIRMSEVLKHLESTGRGDLTVLVFLDLST